MHLVLSFILLPFSLLYGILIALRVGFYEWGIFKSEKAPVAVITVGNLSVGGTGKSPHVEWLIHRLATSYKIAVLSRGYGRKTKGFHWVLVHSKANEVGDEPLQIKQKFDECPMAVCENRAVGIQEMLRVHPEIELFILDDALQHLRIKGTFNILLSTFQNPYFRDWVLPAGRLREFAALGIKRAQVCVFTKCPETPNKSVMNAYAARFSSSKNTYFSAFEYVSWQALSACALPEKITQIFLVTGIANPKPLEVYLSDRFAVELLSFPDHHVFEEKDIARVSKIFANFEASSTVVLSTEKDAVKLKGFDTILNNTKMPWYCIPVRVKMNKEQQLLQEIKNYVDNY